MATFTQNLTLALGALGGTALAQQSQDVSDPSGATVKPGGVNLAEEMKLAAKTTSFTEDFEALAQTLDSAISASGRERALKENFGSNVTVVGFVDVSDVTSGDGGLIGKRVLLVDNGRLENRVITERELSAIDDALKTITSADKERSVELSALERILAKPNLAPALKVELENKLAELRKNPEGDPNLKILLVREMILRPDETPELLFTGKLSGTIPGLQDTVKAVLGSDQVSPQVRSVYQELSLVAGTQSVVSQPGWGSSMDTHPAEELVPTSVALSAQTASAIEKLEAFFTLYSGESDLFEISEAGAVQFVSELNQSQVGLLSEILSEVHSCFSNDIARIKASGAGDDLLLQVYADRDTLSQLRLALSARANDITKVESADRDSASELHPQDEISRFEGQVRGLLGLGSGVPYTIKDIQRVKGTLGVDSLSGLAQSLICLNELKHPTANSHTLENALAYEIAKHLAVSTRTHVKEVWSNLQAAAHDQEIQTSNNAGSGQANDGLAESSPEKRVDQSGANALASRRQDTADMIAQNRAEIDRERLALSGEISRRREDRADRALELRYDLSSRRTAIQERQQFQREVGQSFGLFRSFGFGKSHGKHH